MIDLARLLDAITLSGTADEGAETTGPEAEVGAQRCADRARFFAWLDASASPELTAWNQAILGRKLRAGYHNTFFAATCPTLAEALAVEHDAARAARIRGLFLGTSAILFDREELWFASWGATDEGKSVVFASHQDERDLWPVAPSIADFVLEELRTDSYFAREPSIAAPFAAEPSRLEGAKLPVGFDPTELAPRLDWIVALLFPEGDWYGLGDGLAAAATFARFEDERAILARAPHLVSYWLLHHLVFGNHDALADLISMGLDSAYPPARELAALANEVLQAKRDARAPVTPSWWDEARVARLRADALRTRPALFEPAAMARSETLRQEREALRARIAAALEAQGGSAGAMLVRAVLEGSTLEQVDAEVVRDAGPADPDANLEELLLAKRGNAPGAAILFEQIALDADTSSANVAELVLALVATGEGGEEQLAVATVLLASEPWSRVRGRMEAFGPAVNAGRWMRHALSAAALFAKDDEGATAYLHAEAARFFSQLPETNTATTELAALALLRRRDTAAIAELERTLREAPSLHAGTTRAMLKIMAGEVAFAGALEALVARNFGRDADGEPVVYAARFAAAAPARASRLFEARTDDAPPAKAATLAGLLTARPDDASALAAAKALLAQLDPKKEREAGAALALLRVVHEASIPGFSEVAARFRSSKVSKYVGSALTTWFAKHGDSIL